MHYIGIRWEVIFPYSLLATSREKRRGECLQQHVFFTGSQEWQRFLFCSNCLKAVSVQLLGFRVYVNVEDLITTYNLVYKPTCNVGLG